MEAIKKYEIVFDMFHRRWTFKLQGLPGALQVAKTQPEIIERACPICSNQPCVLRIYNEDKSLAEERAFGIHGRK